MKREKPVVTVLKQGLQVYFVSLNKLIADLKKAYEENRMEKWLRVYLRPRVLVIDEVGYLPPDSPAGSLFFQLINSRYEKGSIIPGNIS